MIKHGLKSSLNRLSNYHKNWPQKVVFNGFKHLKTSPGDLPILKTASGPYWKPPGPFQVAARRSPPRGFPSLREQPPSEMPPSLLYCYDYKGVPILFVQGLFKGK